MKKASYYESFNPANNLELSMEAFKEFNYISDEVLTELTESAEAFNSVCECIASLENIYDNFDNLYESEGLSVAFESVFSYVPELRLVFSQEALPEKYTGKTGEYIGKDRHGPYKEKEVKDPDNNKTDETKKTFLQKIRKMFEALANIFKAAYARVKNLFLTFGKSNKAIKNSIDILKKQIPKIAGKKPKNERVNVASYVKKFSTSEKDLSSEDLLDISTNISRLAANTIAAAEMLYPHLRNTNNFSNSLIDHVGGDSTGLTIFEALDVADKFNNIFKGSAGVPLGNGYNYKVTLYKDAEGAIMLDRIPTKTSVNKDTRVFTQGELNQVVESMEICLKTIDGFENAINKSYKAVYSSFFDIYLKEFDARLDKSQYDSLQSGESKSKYMQSVRAILKFIQAFVFLSVPNLLITHARNMNSSYGLARTMLNQYPGFTSIDVKED